MRGRRKGFEAHGTLSHRIMVQPSRFQALQTEMEGHLFERHDELEGLLLALLSRQHLLLVGPKGAAKSMMIRMLAGAIDRSEERRVGKECRSWGGVYSVKKKRDEGMGW